MPALPDQEIRQTAYDVMTAKLIQKGRVYQYLQADNPGPLELFAQQHENFRPALPLTESELETEDDLIRDEVITSKKPAAVKPPFKDQEKFGGGIKGSLVG